MKDDSKALFGVKEAANQISKYIGIIYHPSLRVVCRHYFLFILPSLFKLVGYPSLFLVLLWDKALTISTVNGIMVLFFSPAISTKVCR